MQLRVVLAAAILPAAALCQSKRSAFADNKYTQNFKRFNCTHVLTGCAQEPSSGAGGIAWDDAWDRAKSSEYEAASRAAPVPRVTHRRVSSHGGFIEKTQEDEKNEVQPETTSQSAPTQRRRRRPVVRNILLIRHGQYEYAKGDENRVLTALGREQARLTGQRLREMGLAGELDRIEVSTMTRALETANIIREELLLDPVSFSSSISGDADIDSDTDKRVGSPTAPLPEEGDDTVGSTASPHAGHHHQSHLLPLVKTDLIRETCPIKPVPAHNWAADRKCDSALLDQFFTEFFVRPSRGEQDGDSWEIVIAHSNVIRYYTLKLLQLPPEAWLRTSIPNCGITWIKIHESGRVSLAGFGDAGHLPWERVTFG